jgi:hypothetical protein
LNGLRLAAPVLVPFVARAFLLTLDGEHLLIGGDHPVLIVYDTATLSIEHVIGSNGAYLHSHGVSIAVKASHVVPDGTAGAVPLTKRARSAEPLTDIASPLASPGGGARRTRRPLSLMPFSASVTSLAFSEHEQVLFVGLENGELRIFTPEEGQQFARMMVDLEVHFGF